MKIYNYIDEQGRYCGFKATTEIGPQEDYKIASYMCIRESEELLFGQHMGLDYLIIKEENENIRK